MRWLLQGGAVSEPEWPAAEFIISNPPFLGRGRLREYLSDTYVDALYALWRERVPAEADYCCYWFEKARAQIDIGRTQRAGLLSTQAIRRGASNEVLVRIKATGDIFFAVSDRQWVNEGAAVRVSMVGFDNGSDTSPRVLDGVVVPAIHADLSSGLDFSTARTLPTNVGRAFQGPVKVGDFDIDYDVARGLLSAPNPHGRPNSDVVRPWLNGQGITKRNPNKFIIDFRDRSEADAALYEGPFRYVEDHVKAGRLKNRDRQRRERWWQLGRSGGDLREAVKGLRRMICTVRVAANRLLVFTPSETLPDARLYAFAAEHDWYLGILHSRVHELWSLKKGSIHGDGEEGGRPTYSVEACFETFPFPTAPAEQLEVIAAAARRLLALREEWLNPSALVRSDSFEFPAGLDGPWGHSVESPDALGLGRVAHSRLLPVDEEAEAVLRGRTLTKLYEESPTWLVNVHRELDAAVLQAYGWEPAVSDEAILARLLDLNLAVEK